MDAGFRDRAMHGPAGMTDGTAEPARTTHLFRFAPTPNGRLHLGHAFSALLNQRCAKETAGTLLLRLEDIDPQRCTAAFERGIVGDLAWLGVEWPAPIIRQSERFSIYAATLADLGRRGLVYPCFCTRGTVARWVAAHPDWPHDPDGAPLYPGLCRGLSADECADRRSHGDLAALRLDCAAAIASLPGPIDWAEYGEGASPRAVWAEPQIWGDVLLGRRDTPASYHLAVVVDDAAQGVTDIVRGEDLFHATGLHRLLQDLLGFQAPRYHHHRLILDEAGRKLSKSRNGRSLADLRAAGETPDRIRHRLGFA